MKMSIYNVKEFNELRDVLDHCEGDVKLITPQGQELSWKENREFATAWAKALPTRSIYKVDVELSSQKDVPYLVTYMMQKAS